MVKVCFEYKGLLLIACFFCFLNNFQKTEREVKQWIKSSKYQDWDQGVSSETPTLDAKLSNQGRSKVNDILMHNFKNQN